MTRRLLRFLLLFVAVPLSATPKCTVTAIYSHKPLITLCGVKVGERWVDDFHGELHVYRGKTLVFEATLDAPPNEIKFGRTPDGKRRIEARLAAGTRNDPVELFRWDGHALVPLGELTAYWGVRDIDIDGDGKRELLETNCCRTESACATHINIAFQRWNGKRYQRVKGDYLDLFGAEAGKPPRPITLSATKEDRETGCYRLIVVNGGGGLRAGEVRLNGQMILGPKQLHAGFRRVAVPLDLRGGPDCPVMTAAARGLLGARLTVLIEILPEAAPAQGADESSVEDELDARLEPLLGDDIAFAAVYDSYPSGRPHHVLAGIEKDDEVEGHGSLLLVSFPDTANGEGTLLHRLDIEEPPVSIEFLQLVDPRDIVVTQRMSHLGGSIYRIVGEKLVRISDDLASEESKIDVDGDGIPELVWYGYAGVVDPCGQNDVYVGGIQRWDGESYEDNGIKYVGTYIVHAGSRSASARFEVKRGKQYILRVYKRPGVAQVDVSIDGTKAEQGLVVLEPGCHEWSAHAAGTPGAGAWVMLEERE